MKLTFHSIDLRLQLPHFLLPEEVYTWSCVFSFCMCVYRIEDDIRALPPDKNRAFLVGEPDSSTDPVCLFVLKKIGHGLGSKL